MDYFSLFQLPIDYRLNLEELTSRYQELQRRYHPDRFATAEEQEQLAALQQTAIINQAYQTLKHPLKRAEYLLSCHGIDIANEQKTMHDTVFLMTQMELHEELDQIESDRDESRLANFHERVKQNSADYFQSLEQRLEAQQWEQAADFVRKLRFLNRLQDSIEQLEDKWFDGN